MTITHILNIQDHPIIYCSDNIKKRYIIGLGCILHRVSNGHPDMKLLFEQWGYSILKENVGMWFNPSEESCISNALKLNRRELHFFRVKHQFYFDCFYLTETFNKSLLDSLHALLKEFGCNIFTKSSLTRTYNFFKDHNATLKVDESLQRHRSENITFSSQTEKRILIVATVSAGKSTLINALTGHYFNKAKNGVCTNHICTIHNKRKHDGITFRNGTTLIYDSEIDVHSSDNIYDCAFHFESTLGDTRICLIDTPGVNNANNSEHLNETSDAIKAKNYDVIIFISNGQYNGTNDELRLLKLLKETTNKPILFVLNQLDKFNNKVDDIGKMICNYSNELVTVGFKNPMIFPISAQYAYFLRSEHNLDEEETDELNMLRTRFSKEYLDLKRYSGGESTSDIEKSGIIQLEQAIKKQII